MEVSLLAVEARERRQGVAARLLSHIEKVSQPGLPFLQPGQPSLQPGLPSLQPVQP